MDDLSGRGLGSGLGLGRVDQGSSFTTTTRSAAEQGEGVCVGVADDDDAAAADADDAGFDAMLILVRCAYTGSSSSRTGVGRLNGAVVRVLLVEGNSGSAQVSCRDFVVDLDLGPI